MRLATPFSGPADTEAATATWHCTFASRQQFGSVAQLSDGTIVVAAEGQSIRMGEAGYWSLMEMLSEASRQITAQSTRRAGGPRKEVRGLRENA